MRARMVVEGVFSGIHSSPHQGSSVEFAEHKEYSQGDEARHIDWRLAAKADKLYVKRFEHETNLRAMLLFDGSGSMAYGNGPFTKFEYAKTVVASLAYLLLEQRDAVGIGVIRDGLAQFIPPRSDRGHLSVLIDALDREKPGGNGSVARTLEQVAERIPRRGLVLIVTDGLENLDELKRSLRTIWSRRHDVGLIQVLDRDEVVFPFEDLTMFKSMEDETSVLVDPKYARRAYLQALDEHCKQLASECFSHQIEYQRFRTDEPIDRALIRYIAQRRS